MQDLTGQTVVITGASRGIGRAMACACARAGANLFLHARTQSAALDETLSVVRAAGIEADSSTCDLAEAANHERLVDAAWNWRGPINAWINNAGADVLTGAAASLDFNAKLELLWQVDVKGTVGLSRAIGARMSAAAQALKTANQTAASFSIVNIGWDQTAHGMAGDSGEMFAATKGAIIAFTRSLAQSLAPHVRVNCLAPGWIQTAWGEAASEYWQARAKKESLLDRWGTPDDVGQAAKYLISPAAAFINGEVINVNGGFRAHNS